MSAQRDEEFLRKAIAQSEAAVAQGGRPFGAVVVDGEGRIVAQAGSVARVDPRDWTAHSEMEALRAACAAMTWEQLGRATTMRAESRVHVRRRDLLVHIRRLVYCVSEPAMRALRAPYERAAGIAMRCDELFARCGRRVEVIGPLLEEEGLAAHRRFWPHAHADA